ncbi:MAG: Uma2 family endonuclease [Bacteroidota bacterium]|nr:Uma2 family endonuclease [Bacteroidota bacterium]
MEDFQMVINTASTHLSDEQFFNLCQENDILRFERTADQQIIVMTPSGIFSSYRNVDISTELRIWNRKHQLGYVFGTDAGFTLPDNSVRAPDASFVSKAKIDALSEFEKERFAHVVPEFVVELMSPSDSLKFHQDKMESYIKNGVQLGWLIYYKMNQVFIYRQNADIEVINTFEYVLSGENILPGFEFDLRIIK